MDDMQPGQLIVPHDPNEPKPSAASAPEQPPVVSRSEPTAPAPAPIAQPSPEPLPSQPVSNRAPQTAADTGTSGWQFHQEDSITQVEANPVQDLQWTASEFIAHDKSPGWYLLLATAAVVATVGIYLLTRDKISSGVVLFAAFAFGVFAARKPETKQYSLSGQGLQIGQKFYAFQDFRTFSVAQEGAISSIVLAPLKRFMPPITLYIGPDMAESVVGFLSDYLPFEQHKNDAVDSLLKRIRF